MNFIKPAAQKLKLVTMPIIIGVAGGSGSGKTTIAGLMCKSLPNSISIQMDSFYVPNDRPDWNYDVVDAFDMAKVESVLSCARRGKIAHIPQYSKETRRVEGFVTVNFKRCRYVIFEGIFALCDKLRKYYSTTIFIDADCDARLARRILRDRGTKDVATTIAEYFNHVRPSYTAIIEPTRQKAELVFYNTSSPAEIDIAEIVTHCNVHY